MSARSPVHSLPIEIAVDILSYLSAKQVQRSRQVCRHFLEMIDDPRNRANIAQSIQRRALVHLQNLVDSTYNFTNVLFPDALSTWLATRGVPRTPQDRLIDLWTFAEIWLSQHPPLPDETGRQDRWMLLYGTRKAASALLGVHLRLRFPEVYDKSEFEGRYGGWRDEHNLFWIYLDGFGPQVKRAYGWSDEMVSEWWQQLNSTQSDSGLLNDARPWPRRHQLHETCDASCGKAMWMMSSIAISPRTNMGVQPLCENCMLSEMLGVPVVPRRIGWFAESEWAWKKIGQLARDGIELPPSLVTAAILEDLGIQ